MLGKSQTIGDFSVSRLSQIWPTNEHFKSYRNLWSSGMEGDKSAAFLFFRRLSDFCVGRRWFPTNEKSNFYRREVGAKLLGSGLPIIHLCTNLIFFGAFSISRQIQYLENLGQYKSKRAPHNISRFCLIQLPVFLCLLLLWRWRKQLHVYLIAGKKKKNLEKWNIVGSDLS